MPLYQPTQPPSLPYLIVPRSDAKTKLEAQIQKGLLIANYAFLSFEEFDKAESEETKWRNVNITLLQSIFSNTSRSDAYASAARPINNTPQSTLFDRKGELKRRINFDIIELESILEGLEYISELLPPALNRAKSANEVSSGNKVFIVHGHDEGIREAVARVLHQLKLTPVILAEQPNQGQTIIEKFEQSSDGISYAVVLLTPDDIGTSKNKPDDLKPRARQNVIFELGYFSAKLGRKNVCALHKGGIEIPSDYHGVAYVSMDSSDWKWRLALEIKQALPVDLNLLS